MGAMVIRSSHVLLPAGVRAAEIHIDGGTISSVRELEPDARSSILDPRTPVIFPGLVDTHVHVNEPGRTEWEGFETATRAAAAGGVTTILDMPLNSVPATTTLAALDLKRR